MLEVLVEYLWQVLLALGGSVATLVQAGVKWRRKQPITDDVLWPTVVTLVIALAGVAFQERTVRVETVTTAEATEKGLKEELKFVRRENLALQNRPSEQALASVKREAAEAKAAREASEARVAVLERELRDLQGQVSTFGPRRVTPEQKAVLVARLRAIKQPFHVIDVSIPLGGPDDARKYAEEIGDTFRAAGWTVPEGMAQGVWSKTPEGVHLQVSPDTPRPVIDAILAALNAAQMGHWTMSANQSLKINQASLIVGARSHP